MDGMRLSGFNKATCKLDKSWWYVPTNTLLSNSPPKCNEIDACVQYPCKQNHLDYCEDLPALSGFRNNVAGRICHCQDGFEWSDAEEGCVSNPLII